MIQNFKSYVDERGSLTAIDYKELPFSPIERVFFVNNVPFGSIRGGHAHRKTSQFLLCISGQVFVYLNDGFKTWIISLKKNQGVFIPPLIWDTQFFCSNTHVVVFANTKYDRSDYITDFKELLSIRKNRSNTIKKIKIYINEKS